MNVMTRIANVRFHKWGQSKKPDARSGFLVNLILSNRQTHSPVHEVVIEHDADAESIGLGVVIEQALTITIIVLRIQPE
jgi:hypothetical protein